MRATTFSRFVCAACFTLVLTENVVTAAPPKDIPRPLHSSTLHSRDLPKAAEAALNQYQREVDRLTEEYAKAVELQRVLLLGELQQLSAQKQESPTQQSALDAAIGKLTGERGVKNLLPEKIRESEIMTGARPSPRTLQPGLLLLEYPRHREQDTDERSFYVEPFKFGDPIGDPQVAITINPLKFKRERNAIAVGYLKVDQPGEYGFLSESFYDRNCLVVDGQIVGDFRDGDHTVNRIQLNKGLVPICVMGFCETRGEVKVLWQPPKQVELGPIPEEKLYSPKKLR